MIRLGLFILLCCYGGQLRAQAFVERVYLKDSVTVYEGVIVAQAPAQYVRIYRYRERDTLQVNMGIIWKITKQYITRYSEQDVTPLHLPKRYYKSLYLEVFGKAAIYSVNFDMRTAKGRRNGWGISSGLSIMGSTGNRGAVAVLVPFGINYLIGKSKHFLEVGAGATYMPLLGTNIPSNASWGVSGLTIDRPIDGIFGHFTFGYRFMPLTKGFTWRLMFSPIVYDGYFNPWLSVSFGYQFW